MNATAAPERTLNLGELTGSQALSEQRLGTLMRVGAILAKSGYFRDAQREAQAVAKVLAGAELGIAPVASLRSIHIIDGQVALAAHLMAGLIKRSRPRYDYKILDWTEERCAIRFFEQGEPGNQGEAQPRSFGPTLVPVGESIFTKADAQQAGLLGKENWRKYPRNMLYSRAMSNGARLYCADLFLGGIYTPEELLDSRSDVGPAEGTHGGGPPWDPEDPQAELLAEALADAGGAELLDDPTTRARRRFWAEARKAQYGLWTDGMGEAEFARNVHRALGLPEESGALSGFAATYGWDVARQMLEDGNRLPYPPEAEDISESDFWQAVGPDGLGMTWADVRAAIGLDRGAGRMQAWLDEGHSYREALAIVERPDDPRQPPDHGQSPSGRGPGESRAAPAARGHPEGAVTPGVR